MIRINDILDQASTYLPPADVALIQKAYVFSAAAHAGQVRLSGEPYLSHPLEVSNILLQNCVTDHRIKTTDRKSVV